MAIRWSTACGQAFFIEVKHGQNCRRRQASSYRGFGVFSGVVELQQKVWADLAFQRGHVVFGVAHVFMH